MGNKFLLLLLLCLISAKTWTQDISYIVDASKAQNNSYFVDLKLKYKTAPDSVLLKMATWTPGSYLIREFSKHVSSYTALNDKQEELKCKKLDKNTWVLYTNGNKEIHFKYQFYAHELSVRTTYLDVDLGLINGASLFIYPADKINTKSEIKLILPEGWKSSTTLENKSSEPNFYISSNFDVLFDSPILLGTHKTFEFEASGTNHRIAINEPAFYDPELIKKDVSKIVETQSQMFNGNPNKEYLFIVITRSSGGGGLEHKNSTTLIVDRLSLATESGHKRFLSLIAHEYFHLWNVKRIRPLSLGPFDYEKENYTDLLWVMEGFTSYYSAKTLYQAGYTEKNAYINRIIRSILSELDRPGGDVQSLAESSLDTWIKFYRDDENDYNATVSYYNKGLVLASLLDMKIIHDTNGDKNLDDLMRYLYKIYDQDKKRGFTSAEMILALNTITQSDYKDFFDQYIFGTAALPIKEVMEPIGFSITKYAAEKTEWGLGIRNSNNHYLIYQVIDNSSAFKAGLNVGDEIIGINEFGFDQQKLDFFSNMYPEGSEVSFLILRNNLLKTIDVEIPASTQEKIQIELSKDLSDEQQKRLDKFLFIN